MLRYLLIAVVSACCTFTFAEETLQDMIKKTDMSDADSVYMLGVWCEENKKPTTARKYYSKVLQIDKDHEAARAKFNQVKVGDRWVAAAFVNGGDQGKDGEGGSNSSAPRRRSSGPGPKASEIEWDLTVPTIERENSFIEGQIMRMQKNANDSDDMDSAVLTLYREDNRAEMVPLLMTALKRDNFDDLYGTSLLIMKYLKDGEIETPRRLLGFLAKASERSNNKEDLEMFAYVAPLMKDRRITPRLIELMGHPEKVVSNAARSSFAQISLVSDDENLTQADAQKWWDQNHDVSPKVWLSEQLKSDDPVVVVSAAQGLYELRDKSLVPAVIKVMAGDNRQANEKAIQLFVRITGNDWGYNPMDPPDKRKKVVKQIEDWWKEKGARFEWIEEKTPDTVAGKAAAPKDPRLQMIEQLASVEGNEAQQAEQNLTSQGKEAVPALIIGLSNPSGIVRRKCNDILKFISKKDVGYDSRGEEVERDKSIKAWQEWATAEGILGDKEGDKEQ